MSFRYVVLCYAPSPVADTGTNIALIGMSLESASDENAISVSTEDGWQSFVDADDVEYFSAVIADLQSADPEERAMIFDALCQMSVGRFRTKVCGECSETEFPLLASSMTIAKAS